MAKVKLNLAGFRAIRQSAPIQQAIDQQATLIASRSPRPGTAPKAT